MAYYGQIGALPVVGGDIPVKNYGVTTISAKLAVNADTSNTINTAGAIGVVVPTTSGSVAACLGTVLSDIPAGKTGLIRISGGAVCKASGSVTVGENVQVDSASGKEGYVKTAGSAAAGFGKALSTAADGEDVLVWVSVGAKNA
jgi:hypothetical protein